MSILALLTYLLSAIIFLRLSLSSAQPSAAQASLGQRIFILAFVLQCLCLLPLIYLDGLKVTTGSDYFFWFALLLAAYFVFWARHLPFPVVGTFISTAVLIFLSGSSYLGHYTPVEPYTPQPYLLMGIHIVPAMLAELCLVILLLVCLVFLIQESRLKRKDRRVLLSRGPSLQVLERYVQRLSLSGFVLMSIALITGSLFAYLQGRSLFSPDIVQFLAITAWLLLASVQFVRNTWGWSARKVAVFSLTVSGFSLVILYSLRVVSGSVWHGG